MPVLVCAMPMNLWAKPSLFGGHAQHSFIASSLPLDRCYEPPRKHSRISESVV
jgi:hypothetical protein